MVRLARQRCGNYYSDVGVDCGEQSAKSCEKGCVCIRDVTAKVSAWHAELLVPPHIHDVLRHGYTVRHNVLL